MTSAAVRARAVSLLGRAAGTALVLGPRPDAWEAALRSAGWAVAADGEGAAAALVSFVGERENETLRLGRLAAARARLGVDAPLVLVDHNQPRPRWRRVVGWLALALHGLSPGRGRTAAARQLDAAGFRVECLRLAAGERVQLVLARREAER